MDSERTSPMQLSRSSSMRTYNTNRTSLVRRNQSMSAKQVRFYRNGDRYFTGLKLAVSLERYKEFDSLLEELSEKLNLPTGAVRFIFNADDNSMITDISQLHYGVPYVCSSSNTFRQIEGGYGKHLHSWSIIPKSKNQFNFKPVLHNIENNIHIFRVDTTRDFIKPKLVTVIRNGKPPQKKVTLLLNSKTAISLDQVLDQLSAKGSLGKVDKLYTVDGRPVKTLKDLFDDDTVFIALSANEKFPDDGIELDPNSYRITPYRELKRPSNMTVRRSNSLRGSIRRYKDENENMSISKIAKNLHGVHSTKSAIAKVTRPRGSSLKKMDQNKEELYPTSVFESDSSESARAKKGRRGRTKGFQSMDIYNTVWLSDFESVYSSGTKSGFSSLNHSRASFADGHNGLGHSTPRGSTKSKSKTATHCNGSPASRSSSKSRLHRTLSLPESDLANINGEDLQERFSRLQIEQENRELRLLVRQLQEALEKLEKTMVSNLTKNAESSQTDSCANQPKVDKKIISSPVTTNTSIVHSPDSLEETNSKEGSEKNFIKTKDTDESGYNTYNNESMLDDPFLKHDENYKLKEYQYMEYSDSMSYSSEEERQYFESRLAKKRGYYDDDDDSICCFLQ